VISLSALPNTILYTQLNYCFSSFVILLLLLLHHHHHVTVRTHARTPTHARLALQHGTLFLRIYRLAPAAPAGSS
jgi:hypothetical protein